jgi:hypothetical protein
VNRLTGKPHWKGTDHASRSRYRLLDRIRSNPGDLNLVGTRDAGAGALGQ